MNDCEHILELLSQRLDRGQRDEAGRLAAELEHCPDETAALFQAMFKLDEMLRHAPAAAPARDLTPQVMARIRRQTQRDRGIIGAGLALSGALAIWPTLIFMGMLSALTLRAWRPDMAHTLVNLLLGGVKGLTLAWIALQHTTLTWAWLFPATFFGLALLTLSFLWAQRLAHAHAYSSSAAST